MSLQGPQKLAILLCKFSDSAKTEPHPATFYKDLFTKRGSAGLNDYWIAASLGAISIDGSQVFGWKTINTTRATFLAAHPGRGDKVRGAIEAFQMDQKQFVAFVAIFADDMGDGGMEPPNFVLAHHGGLDNSVTVTFLAHETGHVFGLEHSFDHSSRVKKQGETQPGEYFDRQDIMSAMDVDSDADHRFSPRGPLLNAANLSRMGWLPDARVWRPLKSSSHVYDIEIVALEHPEVPGYLAAQAGGWIAEFRMADGFDGGLLRPAVIFHDSSAGPNSYIIASDVDNNIHTWQPGQVLGNSMIFAEFGGTLATVLSFDLQKKTARLRVQVKATRPPFVDPALIFGLGIGQLPLHGSLLVLKDGKIVPIPIPEPERVLVDLRAMIRNEVSNILRRG